ncbi:MAG: biotin synthase BioB [Pyrinomonadaceae bacterium]|nr:biotin synthase BioB [Pyrinomonadaceae bacterium]MCX7640031.1 biotin synthase BioB [Pyrinomonadaceae bacterium]MDW8304203.1 biotin synthase BioB [Acidobacteriota bacterium]
MDLNQIVERAIKNEPPTYEEALALLRFEDEETLLLVDAAWRVRRAFFGNRVKVNVLLNAKSGYCPEDCGYCSQSRHAQSQINRYPMMSVEEIVEKAREAFSKGANRFCIVTAMRGPTWRDIERVAEATRRIKAEIPIEICACMGIIDDPAKAKLLKEAGVDAYNHNINTTAERYDKITRTHTYADRVQTAQTIKQAGISLCSGVIIGMGESDEEIVNLAYSLRELEAESIPVNFLIPIKGTPLGNGKTTKTLTPWRCLRVLAIFRLTNPKAEIRASAGREIHLRTLQPLAMLIANSLFLGDYLTEKGQKAEDDWQMLEDLGLIAQL